MTCEAIQRLIAPYFYGELGPEEEDQVEEHLHRCTPCTRDMERQRYLAQALAQREVTLAPELLEECRADLRAAIQGGAPRRAESPAAGPWTLFLHAVQHSFSGLAWVRQPALAAALVAIGFFSARLTNHGPQMAGVFNPSDQIFNTVRSVQPDPSGGVQIAFDETHRRMISGRIDDAGIQRLLLAAAREDNPAVRVESMDLLRNRAESGEVKDALLNAVANDPNPGVRLKAVEGLKTLAGDAEVRKTLAEVLLADDNPAVRMRVVDLLVEHRDEAIVGVLQDLMQKEDNNYVRLKSEKALKEMNASIGTF